MPDLPGLFKVKAAYKPTAEIDTFVGEKGELFYNETEKQLRISDGTTPGGIAINVGDITGVTGFTVDQDNNIIYLNNNFDLIPTQDNNQSLGSAENRWKDLYVSGGTIYIGDGLEIKVETSTGTLSLPANTVVRDNNSGQFESLANSNQISSIETTVTELQNTISETFLEEVSVNGKQVTLLFEDYSISKLINFEVLDSNQEKVEVSSKIQNDRLVLESNLNLENHLVRLIYQ